MPHNVAIVGATGLVGHTLLQVLEQRRFPVRSLRLYASERSAGQTLPFRGRELPVELLDEATSFKGIDVAFFSPGTDVSRAWAPRAAADGAIVVDNSFAFRLDPQVPLVVPEVNPHHLAGHKGIIANPNCSTIQMVVPLAALHRHNPLRRVIVSTYQSVSGTGAAAVDELREQSRAALAGQEMGGHVYRHPIAFNVLPEVDVFLEADYTQEEWKMVWETRKIMDLPDLPVTATCVRVPVYVGHSEMVYAEFERPCTVAEAREQLAAAPGVAVVDDPAGALYPHALQAAGRDDVLVGRLRRDLACENALVMWVVADNLRKGAALNAVQIAEELHRQGLL